MARQVTLTHGHTVVPRGMALLENLRNAAAILGVLPPRERDPLTELMFRTETLHDFGDYVASAYEVREQIKTLIGTRRRVLEVQDVEVTRALDEAIVEHNALPSNATVYAISNTFRHRIRPDTINWKSRFRVLDEGGAEMSVIVYLGMADLTNGQGWTREAKSYVGADGQVELLPLVEGHLMSSSRLVPLVTSAIHDEFRGTGRR